LRPILACHFDGRGDLSLVGQVANVAEAEENVLQLPRLVVEVFRLAAVQVSDGGE
jgi:hypothetical protein